MPLNSLNDSNVKSGPKTGPRPWNGHARWLEDVLAQDGPNPTEQMLGEQARQRLTQGCIDEEEERLGKWEAPRPFGAVRIGQSNSFRLPPVGELLKA